MPWFKEKGPESKSVQGPKVDGEYLITDRIRRIFSDRSDIRLCHHPTHSMVFPYQKSYGQRALKQTNPTAKLLLETMERKKSNLAVSVDVTKTKDFLAIVDVVGPFVCLIKAIFLSSESPFPRSYGI